MLLLVVSALALLLVVSALALLLVVSAFRLVWGLSPSLQAETCGLSQMGKLFNHHSLAKVLDVEESRLLYLAGMLDELPTGNFVKEAAYIARRITDLPPCYCQVAIDVTKV